MAEWKYCLLLLSLAVGWSVVAAMALSSTTDGKIGQVRALGNLPELVFKVQQIYIKYDCAYQDPDGVCSPTSSPNCADVKNSAVCVLNSCEQQSESDRDTVAEILSNIAQLSHNKCDLNKEDILQAANGQKSVDLNSWILLFTSIFCVMVTRIQCITGNIKETEFY
ncbi:hypothetical protein RRG08_032304 [Elysia crispata]|uniref:Uncharacterized protein n=1 Tax=Elysia crispata TaxID=231223 RepID=A0AAE1ARF7_9GAST|nr:hypothetical protein RRG08_032304 [Elysia crispata]